MFHVHSSCISNMKNIKGNIQPKEVSVVNTEFSLKVKRVMLMMFSIDLVQHETQHLHFKVFLTICMHRSGWLSERGGNFLNLLQKKGDTQKEEGFPQKKGDSNPGGNYWGRKNKGGTKWGIAILRFFWRFLMQHKNKILMYLSCHC